MSRNGDRDLLNVLRDHVIAAFDIRHCLSRSIKCQASSSAHIERPFMMRPSARCELKHVFGLRLINSNGLDLFLQFENFVSVGHCKSAVRSLTGPMSLLDVEICLAIGIANAQAHHKTSVWHAQNP